MKDFCNEFMGIEFVEKQFDCIRLIDMEGESLFHEKHIHTSLFSVPSFVYKVREELYHRCIASNTAVYQVELDGQYPLLFAVLPIYAKKRKFVMECIANITGRITINGILDQSINVLNNAYRLSITDDLTGLYNRRYINQMLPIAIANCAKRKLPLTVIFTDLDCFKDINDAYGHGAGDWCLVEFAKELKRTIRKDSEWAARYGGDEFLLCFMGTDSTKAKLIADGIREVIEQKTFLYQRYEIKTTCSFGVYTIEDFQNLPTSDFILKEVDVRLYEAKKAGRNMVG